MCLLLIIFFTKSGSGTGAVHCGRTGCRFCKTLAFCILTYLEILRFTLLMRRPRFLVLSVGAIATALAMAAPERRLEFLATDTGMGCSSSDDGGVCGGEPCHGSGSQWKFVYSADFFLRRPLRPRRECREEYCEYIMVR